MLSLSALVFISLLAGRALASISGRAAADTPSYCRPPDKVDTFNNYVYKDQTAACQASGHCAHACVILVQNTRGCSAWSYGSYTDLEIAMINQSVKDGWRESTTQGSWTVTLVPFTTALPNRAVIDEWAYALIGYWKPDRPTPESVYFITVDASGQRFAMRADLKGC